VEVLNFITDVQIITSLSGINTYMGEEYCRTMGRV